MVVMRGSLRLILLSNYPKDQQWSMLNFADILERELPQRSIQVIRIFPKSVFGRLVPGRFGAAKWLGYIDKLVLFPRKLRREVRKYAGSVLPGGELLVHICDHSNAIYVKALQKLPHLITCNDLMAIRSARGEFSDNPTRWTGRVLQRMILSGLKGAANVACISGQTETDFLRLLPEKAGRTRVVHMGSDTGLCRLDEAEVKTRLARLNLTEGDPVILHVGNNSWYKNRMGVLGIFRRIREETGRQTRLVIVGASFSTEQRGFIRDAELEDSIDLISSLSREELCALYSTADVFLFPSLYEGFGWPPIEAQACGCPVVAGRGGSLSEILGESALIAEGKDEEALAQHVVSALYNDKLRSTLIEKGYTNAARFSVEAMIDGYVECYREILAADGRKSFAPVDS